MELILLFCFYIMANSSKSVENVDPEDELAASNGTPTEAFSPTTMRMNKVARRLSSFISDTMEDVNKIEKKVEAIEQVKLLSSGQTDALIEPKIDGTKERIEAKEGDISPGGQIEKKVEEADENRIQIDEQIEKIVDGMAESSLRTDVSIEKRVSGIDEGSHQTDEQIEKTIIEGVKESSEQDDVQIEQNVEGADADKIETIDQDGENVGAHEVQTADQTDIRFEQKPSEPEIDVGWFTVADSCADFNKKLFSDPKAQVETTRRSTYVRRRSTFVKKSSSNSVFERRSTFSNRTRDHVKETSTKV